MDNESFHDGLIRQYVDEIREAYIECEHKDKFNIEEYKGKLNKLLHSAKVEGLSADDFWNLVEEQDSEIFSKLNL
ncbi:MAG: hypothetical protein OEV78_05350 [Spirochaetia bacterium]|nr:hypothetical protein [Spirochaetia bacterium]